MRLGELLPSLQGHCGGELATRQRRQEGVQAPLCSCPRRAGRIRRASGFTIIELMLAMTFVSILIIGITVLVMNIQGIYRRGIATREVNSTSRSVVDDITRAIASAPTTSANVPHAVEFINGSRVEGGVFCTGFYSYIWKQADFLWDNSSSSGGGAVQVNGSKDYRLLKARDVGRELCQPSAIGASTCPNNNGKLLCPVAGSPNLTATDTTELISSGGLELALFDFDIFKPAKSNITDQVFYAGSFILGTPRGANVLGGLVSAEVCEPPSTTADAVLDFQYCSINKFNFAASSLGTVGEG